MSDGESRQSLDVAEIDFCQKHIDNSTIRSWQSAGILLAGTIAALALMVDVSGSEEAVTLITTVFALGALLILEVWLSLVEREEALRLTSKERMATLERKLGLRRQQEIKEADDKWERQHKRFWIPKDNTAALVWSGRTVQLGWVALVVWRMLILGDAL
jgi:hypothetical protein